MGQRWIIKSSRSISEVRRAKPSASFATSTTPPVERTPIGEPRGHLARAHRTSFNVARYLSSSESLDQTETAITSTPVCLPFGGGTTPAKVGISSRRQRRGRSREISASDKRTLLSEVEVHYNQTTKMVKIALEDFVHTDASTLHRI